MKTQRRVTLHGEMAPDLHLDFAGATADQLSQTAGPAYRLDGDGTMRFVGVATEQLVTTRLAPRVPWFAASAAVTFNGAATALDTFKIGLFKDAANWLVCRYNHASRSWDIGLSLLGVERFGGGTTRMVEGLARVGLMVGANIASAWAHNGRVWQEVSSFDLTPFVDLRTMDLAGWHYGWGAVQDVAGVQAVSDFKAGPAGGTGLRDVSLVTFEDGSPYLVDGRMFVTATVAGPGSASSDMISIAACGFGVFGLDPATCEIVQTGRLVSYRAGNAATRRFLLDAAGKLVFDREIGRWRVLVSSWGDYDTAPHHIDCFHQVLDGSPLAGTTILRDLDDLRLRGSDEVAYDPELVKADGMWRLAYVAGLMGVNRLRSAGTVAALARATPLALNAGEGPKIRKIGAKWYVLIGSRTAILVHHLRDGSFAGTLDVPYTASMGVVPPHPNIVPVGEEGWTRYKMVTFNDAAYEAAAQQASGSFSHGDLMIFESQSVRGVEYPEGR